MPSRPHVKGIPAELRSEAAILAAVAREALLECHIKYAVDLVELGRGRVAPDRMLEIYARLHHLDDELEADVRGRALATLGDRAIRYAVLAPMPERTAPEPEPPADSMWGRVRSRFSRRMHHGLRREVDRHTGRCEIELMEVHTEHALRFVRALNGRFNTSHAVRLYAEALGLRDTLRETLYLLVLSRLGDAAPETPVRSLPSEGLAGIAVIQ
jgi:hypothetical protein